MSKPKKKTTRKNRFITFTLKLSYRQFQSLRNYSKIKGITPIKVVKDRINDCIEKYSNEQIGRVVIPKNQLNLFETLSPEEQQLQLFE